ncbi:unnamed protein product [Gongylonema pulchrum]|uniref:Uncharacterized protein n=1 Tax=Gongylonema pulchrum TaxID=637853 RepID=A0A183E5I6_9BILA|nr:unnamed protein product [Gongylonema pulchrum]
MDRKHSIRKEHTTRLGLPVDEKCEGHGVQSEPSMYLKTPRMEGENETGISGIQRDSAWSAPGSFRRCRASDETLEGSWS